MKLNLNPIYSPVWRFIAAKLTAVSLGAAAYVVKHPEVMTDPAAQTAAVATLVGAAVSWLAGSLLPKPVAQ